MGEPARLRRRRRSPGRRCRSRPPSWCATLTSPDAAPASSDETAWMPAVVSGVNAAPMPTPMRISGAPMPSTKPVVSVIWLSQAIPVAATSSAADEQRQVADPRRDARHDAHEREQHERHRQERQPGLQRRLPAHVLQVLGQEEEHREHAADREHARDIGAGAGAAREQPQRRDRLAGAALDAQEDASSSSPAPKAPMVIGSPQPLGGRADEAVDDAVMPTVEVAAPARSRCPCWGSVSGRWRAPAPRSPMPMGTLMNRPQRHDSSR